MRNRLLIILLSTLLGGCMATIKPDAADSTEPVTPALVDISKLTTQPHISYQVRRNDLWDRVRDGFALPNVDDVRIDAQLGWYVKNQAYLDRVADRAAPYLHYIVNEIEKRNIPLEIALLPIVESAFDPFAYSHGRAAGLWQFVPGTGRRYDLKQNWWYDGRRDVAESTRAALDYLSELHAEFDDWLLAVAAYNSGEGRVRYAIRQNQRSNRPTDFWSLRLPRETAAYVPKLLALQKLVRDPAAYDIKLKRIDNEPVLGRVRLSGQVDLARVAELAEMEVREVYLLNPGFNRWATDPDGPHELFLPADKADQFSSRFAELPEAERVNWQRHLVRSGDTLGAIANRYHTSVNLLKQINNLRGNLIRTGQYLMVPTATRSLSNYALSESQRLAHKQNIPREGLRMEHVVSSGESFWSIAQRHGVGVRELAAWNGMAPTDPLTIGKKLVVWSKTGATSQVLPRSGIPADTLRKITYRVRNGDSLWRIASKFGVSTGDLLRWNGISSDKYLQPGQRLKVYVDVTSQSM